MKRVILLTALMLSAVSLFGCGSNTPESTIPTLDQTVKSRNGDKVLFFEGEDEETINPSMDNFNNVWFKIVHIPRKQDLIQDLALFGGVCPLFQRRP